MRVGDSIVCDDFPCTDIDSQSYTVPDIDVEPDDMRIAMISEAPPADIGDYFYAPGTPAYLQTTIQAFRDAGVDVSSIADILGLGVYITTAVKCGKTGYSISSATVKTCSCILERELVLFPNVEVILLMGDVAIKAFNYIARRATGKRAIPSGSTYKIRRNEYSFQDKRLFPSYLQVGRSYLIEKSKQRMIAEDIKAAMALVQ
jgi:uracil-DNA glycosylase